MNKQMSAHKHDCDRCVFLGRDGDFDLYYCAQVSMPTLIARWGSDGPDYKSGISFVGRDAEITRAFDLAKARGLINT